MELRKIKDGNDMIEIEIKGESVGFVNLIKEELWNDSNVKEAAYIKEHPYMAEPKIFVKMKGKSNPKIALERTVKRLQTRLKDLERQLKRNLKD